MPMCRENACASTPRAGSSPRTARESADAAPSLDQLRMAHLDFDVLAPAFRAAASPTPGSDRFRVFSYLTAPNAERYVQIIELFVVHKRRFGLRLSPRDLLALWQDTAPETAPTADELILALDQLYEWEAVDRQADTGRAGSTAEFKRARNTYDITAAGEASWEAAQTVLALERRVASLGQQRLRRIAGTLDA